jgi:hypothetical protein
MARSWSSPVSLAPLEPLLRVSRGTALPLRAKLARLYGDLRMPRRASHPVVFSNFVITLDGVVSLRIKGHAGGGDISGFNIADRMVMGLLRAIADVLRATGAVCLAGVPPTGAANRSRLPQYSREAPPTFIEFCGG